MLGLTVKGVADLTLFSLPILAFLSHSAILFHPLCLDFQLQLV